MEMTPGCIYTDRKGKRYLYLGFGNWFENNYCHVGCRGIYVYLEMSKYEKLVAKGQLVSDLSSFTGAESNNTGIPYFLNFREKPIRFVEDVVEKMFPEGMFSPLKILDYTPRNMRFRGVPTEYELKQKRK